MEHLQHLSDWLIPNLSKMIVTWISSGILVFIFYKYFWTKLKGYMENRREYISSSLTEAEESKVRAKESEEEALEQLKEARVQSNAIISDSKEKATKVHEEIVTQAQEEAHAKIEDARLEIEKEKNDARKEIEKEIVGVALGAAKEVIKGNIDEKKSEEIVDGFIKEIKS